MVCSTTDAKSIEDNFYSFNFQLSIPELVADMFNIPRIIYFEFLSLLSTMDPDRYISMYLKWQL